MGKEGTMSLICGRKEQLMLEKTPLPRIERGKRMKEKPKTTKGSLRGKRRRPPGEKKKQANPLTTKRTFTGRRKRRRPQGGKKKEAKPLTTKKTFTGRRKRRRPQGGKKKYANPLTTKRSLPRRGSGEKSPGG